MVDVQRETIIQQNAVGTSTINIETGGTMSFTGTSTNADRLFLGNAMAGADQTRTNSFSQGSDNAPVNASRGRFHTGSAPPRIQTSPGSPVPLCSPT